MILMMIDLELISLERQFIDGTKIEANAHKYNFIWGKTILKKINKDFREK